MSAECDKCGWDLTGDLRCVVCEGEEERTRLQRENEELRGKISTAAERIFNEGPVSGSPQFILGAVICYFEEMKSRAERAEDSLRSLREENRNLKSDNLVWSGQAKGFKREANQLKAQLEEAQKKTDKAIAYAVPFIKLKEERDQMRDSLKEAVGLLKDWTDTCNRYSKCWESCDAADRGECPTADFLRSQGGTGEQSEPTKKEDKV